MIKLKHLVIILIPFAFAAGFYGADFYREYRLEQDIKIGRVQNFLDSGIAMDKAVRVLNQHIIADETGKTVEDDRQKVRIAVANHITYFESMKPVLTEEEYNNYLYEINSFVGYADEAKDPVSAMKYANTHIRTMTYRYNFKMKYIPGAKKTPEPA